MNHHTARMAAVQAPVIPIVGDWVRQTPGAISLGQGVVHYGPPPEAVEGIERFLADPENHKYRPVQGIPELLEAIERKLAVDNGIRLGPDQAVVVTAGGNMAFQAAILAIADPGDEVILQIPYYFNHDMAIVIAGCKPVPVPTDADYQLQPDAIRAAITPRTRAVVTISPNNPTGAVYPESALREVNALCAERGIYHINDEAYEHFVYGGARHFSPASIPDTAEHTISLFSLSKSYGFASWRIGWMVIPRELLAPVKKILDTVLICPPVISQYAAVGAMSAGSGWVRERVEAIEALRPGILEQLSTLEPKVHVPPANGAFYFLLRVDTRTPPMELVERLVKEFGVGVMPGSAFGVESGCALRISYGSLLPETVSEGIGRLVHGLRQAI